MTNKILIVIISLIYLSCASSTYNSKNQNVPEFGLSTFNYGMFPDKKFIVLSEHTDHLIALKILGSYSTQNLINAFSIAYVQLPAEQQGYVSNAFANTDTFPYRFNEAITLAVTKGDEVEQDPILNSLKNLLIVTYSNMTLEEVQVRYYYGLSRFEQETFKNRWNRYNNWHEQQKVQQQQAEQEVESESGGSSFWGTLGKVMLGIVAGYAAYRAATYNSRIEHNLTQLRMQNFQMQSQIGHIQSNLNRLAY